MQDCDGRVSSTQFQTALLQIISVRACQVCVGTNCLLIKIACYWFCTNQTQKEMQQPESSCKRHGERQEKLVRIFRKLSGSLSNRGLTQRRTARKKQYYSAIVFLFVFAKYMLKQQYMTLVKIKKICLTTTTLFQTTPQ